MKNGNKGPGADAPDQALNSGVGALREDGSTGRPPWTGGGGSDNGDGMGGGMGGGRPPGAGTKKGELFGDQYVLFRDLDPTDDEAGSNTGGDGEPVLDANGQLIPVGYDPLADDVFPIYFEADAEGDYEIPADLVPYVQEVALDRANVARAPERVITKALLAALDKIENADVIDTDPAGRIMYSNDGGTSFATIDAPLENLALYQYLMTPTGSEARAWPDVTGHWPDALKGLLGADLTDPDWDPSSLLGAAWSKDGKITLDAMIYENTVLGVNEVTGSGATLSIDYFDFSTKGAGAAELYTYDREAQYDSTWLLWYENTDADPDLEAQYGTVYDAVFGDKTPDSGVPWEDTYIAIDDMGTPATDDDDFVVVSADKAGVNDFAQAADDARAVISFMHTFQAVEIDESEVPAEFLGMDVM